MKEFHINGYRLQYWLYAVLNSTFGSDVRFQRDSLHRVYSVNRHGFEVSSHNNTAEKVKNTLVSKLLEAGFKPDTHYNESQTHYVKVTQRNSKTETLYVSVDTQNFGLDYRNSQKPVVIVTPFAYWR